MEQVVKPDWLTEEIESILKLHGFPVSKDGMLMLHEYSKNRLTEWKAAEMEYRKICVNFLVPEKKEGTTNVELGGGYVAKVTKKLNYKLDSDNDKIWATLDKVAAIGNEGKFIADRLVSWEPSFLLTEWRQLEEDADKGSQFAKDVMNVVHEVLTITEAAPTLEIKEPKKGKK